MCNFVEVNKPPIRTTPFKGFPFKLTNQLTGEACVVVPIGNETCISPLDRLNLFYVTLFMGVPLRPCILNERPA